MARNRPRSTADRQTVTRTAQSSTAHAYRSDVYALARGSASWYGGEALDDDWIGLAESPEVFAPSTVDRIFDPIPKNVAEWPRPARAQ